MALMQKPTQAVKLYVVRRKRSAGQAFSDQSVWRHAVADDKSKTDGRDRSRVSGSEPYEVEYFAQKHGLSAQQARDLIAEVGNDREKLDAAAGKVNGQRGSA